MFDLKINVGHCDLYLWSDAWPQNKCRSPWPIFHGPVILPYILKTIWCMYIILSEYESVWPDVWPQNKCRSLWPVFHGPVIVPYTLKARSCMNIIIWDYESVWADSSPQNKCNMTYISWSSDFYVISWRLFDVWTSSLGIMGQYDWTFDLKVNVCHFDLYFMELWFCLIFQRLLDGWVSYF